MTTFPCCAVKNGAIVAMFASAAAFVTGNGVKHPASAWASWSPDDWAEKTGWAILPLIDAPPASDPATQKVRRNPWGAWTVDADAVTATYSVETLSPAEVQERALNSARLYLQETDPKMPRSVEDVMDTQQTADPAAYALLPVYTRLLHAARKAARASLTGGGQ
jgi:hypothetical protein